MKYRFVPPGKPLRGRDGDGPGHERLPQALLDRHGARVLHPSSVPVADGWPRPRSTVYRARTLLVPQTLQRRAGFFGEIGNVLARVGMSIEAVDVPAAIAKDPSL